MNSLSKVNISWKIYLLFFVVWIIASLLGWLIANYLFILGEGSATLITSFSTLAVAIATILLVIITHRVATVTKDTIHSQILLQLSRDYASDDMLMAMKSLRKWHNDHGENFVERFLEKLGEDVNWKNDLYRRRISHHFYQIYLLKQSNVIDDNFLKSLVKQGKIDFFLEVIKPLDLAIANRLADEKWDDTKITFLKETFKFFEQLRDTL